MIMSDADNNRMFEMAISSDENGGDESGEEWIGMTADADLIAEIAQEIQKRDMTMAEFFEMCHEEYAAITN